MYNVLSKAESVKCYTMSDHGRGTALALVAQTCAVSSK